MESNDNMISLPKINPLNRENMSIHHEDKKPASGIVKRSVRIYGHRTSVSLENAFWTELQILAGKRGSSLNALIAEIDQKRQANLSSALRLWVLGEIKKAGQEREA